MPKTNLITCIAFGESELRILVINPLTAKVEKRVNLDSPAKLIDSGAAGADFVRKIFIEHDLPLRVKIMVNLQNMEIKQLVLPIVPRDELDSIVRDEAARESVFTYSGEQVAVTYRVLGRSMADARIAKQDILAISTPQRFIDNVVALLTAAGAEIAAIQPSVVGLETVLARAVSPSGEWPILLSLTSNSSELYIWEKERLQFWRALSVGAANPVELRQELLTSIERFQQRLQTVNPDLSQVLLCGESVELGIEPEYQTRVLTIEREPALLGIGVARPDDLDFLAEKLAQQKRFAKLKAADLFLPIALLTVALAVWAGWGLWNAYSIMQKETISFNKLQTAIAQKEQQLQQLRQSQGQTTGFLSGDLPIFMDRLRRIVPGQLRFDSIELLPERQQMILSGICTNQSDLTVFINEISRLKGVKAVGQVNTQSENDKNEKLLSFKIQIALGGL